MNVPFQINDDLGNLTGHLDDEARWTRKDLPPGTGHWAKGLNGQIAQLRFTCPCGCGDVISIPVVDGYGCKWGWNQDTAKPTLTPSILRTTQCRWHGFLTNGIFTSC